MPVALLLACSPEPAVPSGSTPILGEPEFVVPSDRLDPAIEVQQANNNLAVAWHEGRRFLAWRTGPNHFASADVVLQVASSGDEGQTWQDEGSFALGTDLREPHLVSWGGALTLYFAVLGTDPTAFEPQGTKRAEYLGPGAWTDPVDAFEPTFIPWRIQEAEGALYTVGYTGGENIYDPDGDPIRIYWYRSEDGITWSPAAGGDGVVHEGGGSETAWAFLDDGSLVAVIRNEAGEDGVFGSLICTAPAEDLGSWDCVSDPRKYDSPLMFRAEGRTWLVARRHVTETGHYDLFEDLPPAEAYLAYQADYWSKPKRCSLWEVDPEARSVAFVLDLPSAGDTCFPDRLELADGGHEIWNYTSPVDQPDLSWLQGQTGPTSIYRIELTFAR